MVARPRLTITNRPVLRWIRFTASGLVAADG